MRHASGESVYAPTLAACDAALIAVDPFYGYPLWMDHDSAYDRYLSGSDDFDDIDFGYDLWEDPRQEDDADSLEMDPYEGYDDWDEWREEERREAAADALEAPFAHLPHFEAVSPRHFKESNQRLGMRDRREKNSKRRGKFKPWRDRTGRTKAQCLAADESDRDAWNAWAENFCNHDFGGY